ncbi:acyl-CoA dehydrogenase family protein [Actinomadura scrupuli]|uniref:acyl-CoA dehydrogenase family protein n=1 Tax=Actinomadura scrupuli TaxID=559629 RepID=UPI003D97538A
MSVRPPGGTAEEALLAATVGELVRDLRPDSVGDLPRPGPRGAEPSHAEPSHAEPSHAEPSHAEKTLDRAGLLTMRLPAEHGGAEATAVQVALVAYGLAQGLVAVPFTARQIAAELRRIAGVPAAGERAAYVLNRELDGWGRPGTGLVVDAAGARHGLTVQDGCLLSVPTGAPVPGADLTRFLAFTGGVGAEADAGTVLGELAEDGAAAAEAFACALLAADLAGTARGALDEALAHVRTREQFGRPVGAFQAVRHLAPDAEVALAAAEAIWRHAARCVDEVDPAGARRMARVAKALCADIAVDVCETSIQLLGGTGLTWEHLAHARLRRALLGRRLFGGPESCFSAPDALDARLDLLDSPDETVFRDRLRGWLTAHPAAGAGGAAAWHRTLYAAGYVGVSFPSGDGGHGRPAVYEAIVNEELGAAQAPPAPPIGHIANALRLFGDAGQRDRHLTRLLSGEVRWCQGFSEPGAGSDLAAVTTRAGPGPGGGYLVTGTKIWTSDALDADRCLLLCRTGPEGGRDGLSVLLVDMSAPGVEARPIRTAFGTEEFAQVYFDDVPVPRADLLGEPGDGWRIAMTMLGYERGPADIGWISRLGRSVAALRGTGSARPGAAAEVGRAEAWLCALQLHVRGRLIGRVAGTSPGPEGSIDKLLLTRVDQRVRRLRLDLAGADALLGAERAGGPVLTDYLWSRAAGIYGGTEQIQRDIVGHRVLRLPRE